MKTALRPLHLRLLVLSVFVVIAAGLIGWSALASWRKFDELREGIRLAQRLEEEMLGLHAILNDLALGANREDLQILDRKSHELAAWLEFERLAPATERERRLLGSIQAAYSAYLVNIDDLTALSPESSVETLATTVALEEQLARVLRESLARFFDDVQRGLAPRQILIFVLLALLLVTLVAVSVVVHREMIAPLRVRLIEAREAIAQSEKLASLGVLAAGIAHEIRNPLTAIKVRLYTHKKNLMPDSPAREDVAFIGGEINRLERIVRDFLLFARPTDPEFEPVSLLQLLRDVRELLGSELARFAIELQLEEQTDVTVEADRNHLKQVIINLVRNSAESIGQCGRVVLRVRQARVLLRGVTREAAIVEVEDNGKGIPPEIQKKLFDPFFTTKPSGTGLGLAVAARIVEKHGGALRFQTQVNRGTTFGVVLRRGKQP